MKMSFPTFSAYAPRFDPTTITIFTTSWHQASGNEPYCCLGEQNWTLLEDLPREIRFLETRPMKTAIRLGSFRKIKSTLAA